MPLQGSLKDCAMGTPMLSIELCDRFSYPHQVFAHLAEITSVLQEISDNVSVILVGSTARGELSWMTVDGSIRLLSDYELVVVFPSTPSRQSIQRAHAQMDALERGIKGSPLFHIDWPWLTRKQVRYLETTIRTWDLKQNGLPLCGQDVRELVPDVTSKNLDFYDLNCILIWRLWALTLYCPARLVRGLTRQEDVELYQYVICRNVLDITTWLLPHLGVLLPTFEDRVEYISTHFTALQLERWFDPGFVGFLKECLRGKLKLVFNRPLVELHTLALRYLQQAFGFLLRCPMDSSGNSRSEIPERMGAFFEVPGKRDFLRDVAYVLGHHRASLRIPSPLIKWLSVSKFALMGNSLLSIQIALNRYLAGDNSYQEILLDAEHLVEQLLLGVEAVKPANSAAFPERWLHLRRCFANFLLTYFRSMRGKEVYFKRVLAG